MGLGLASNRVSGNSPSSSLATSPAAPPGGTTSPTVALVPQTLTHAGASRRHALRGLDGLEGGGWVVAG